MYRAGVLDERLRKALKRRTDRDSIRKVHLRGPDAGLSTSIVASLTPDDQSIRSTNIESIFLTNVNLTNFFTRCRFPKLRDLSLFECSGFTLNYLKSNTKLINLTLRDRKRSPTLIASTSQLLSLLSSNSHLQTIDLYLPLVNDGPGGGCQSQVPLPHLKRFSLTMDFRHALTILQRLKFPDMIDQLNLDSQGCTLEAARQVIGSYIRDYFQGDVQSKNKLGIFVSSSYRRISLEVSIMDVWDWHPDQIPKRNHPCATFTISVSQHTHIEEQDGLCIDLFALLPHKRVVYLKTDCSVGLREESLVTMPNIEMLYLSGPVISERFLLPDSDGPNACEKLLPSLQCLCLEAVVMEDDDSLVRYLTHQTSGDQRITLGVFGGEVHMCCRVEERIRGLVERLVYSPDPYRECPFDCCSDHSDFM